MKVTKSLRDWLRRYMQDNSVSYTELARRAGTNYQNFQRIAQGVTEELTSNMEDSIILACRITKRELYKISEGVNIAPEYDDQCERALALWRWVAYDEKRIEVIKALGFSGALPPPIHGQPRKENNK